MMKPEYHCVASAWILAVQHAFLECTHRETAPGHAELVFHVVGVGRDVLVCGEALSSRLRIGMMGRRTSLLATERGAAALGALDGTYLVCRESAAAKTSNARNANLIDLLRWRWRSTRAALFLARLRVTETGLPRAVWSGAIIAGDFMIPAHKSAHDFLGDSQASMIVQLLE